MAKDNEAAATAIGDLMARTESAFNVSQLVQSLFVKFGGIDRFAEEYVLAYNSTKPGSIARTKMLQDMLKMFHLAAPKGGNDVGHLSTEELQQVLQTLLEKAGITGTTAPVTPENAATEATDSSG